MHACEGTHDQEHGGPRGTTPKPNRSGVADCRPTTMTGTTIWLDGGGRMLGRKDVAEGIAMAGADIVLLDGVVFDGVGAGEEDCCEP